MSTDKIDPTKKDPEISSAANLTKTTSKGDVELNEEELKQVSGGITIPLSDVSITSHSHGSGT